MRGNLQMTLWAMAKSPLMFGGDMINIDNATIDILTNPVALEINANSFGNMEVLDSFNEIITITKLTKHKRNYLVLNRCRYLVLH